MRVRLCDLAHLSAHRTWLPPTYGCRPGAEILEVKMTASFEDFLTRFFATSPEQRLLKVVTAFCGTGLLVSFLAMSYGVDLSPGLF